MTTEKNKKPKTKNFSYIIIFLIFNRKKVNLTPWVPQGTFSTVILNFSSCFSCTIMYSQGPWKL